MPPRRRARFAATCWGLASNVVATTEGLFGKAFSDLNRNGVYDEDADVIRVVSLESEHAIVNAIITLGDMDGDGVPDATERNDGTDPYDAGNFAVSATVLITDIDAEARFMYSQERHIDVNSGVYRTGKIAVPRGRGFWYNTRHEKLCTANGDFTH